MCAYLCEYILPNAFRDFKKNYLWNSFVFHYIESKSFCLELRGSFPFTKGVLALFPASFRTPPPRFAGEGADTLYCIIPSAPFAHCSPSLICLDWYSVFHSWQLFSHSFHTSTTPPAVSETLCSRFPPSVLVLLQGRRRYCGF